MKALLSVSYGCVLAVISSGPCQAAAAEVEPPKSEVALDAPATDLALPTPAGSVAPRAATPSAPPKSASAPSAPPSKNVTINLINRLVQRGVLTKEDADELIKQAEADTARALEQDNAANRMQAEQPPPPDGALFRPSVAPPPAEAMTPPVVSIPSPADAADEVRVTYVPETVRRQIAEQVREEVMQKARDENWANPRTLPRWTLRITPIADFRLRYEGIFFPEGNDNTGAFPNFNAINTGAPFDVTGVNFSPQLNVDENRNRFRIRVRFGVQMDLQDNFTFGLRIATGETNAPTTQNQSLGVANGGQGGNFSKYNIWLDRAFVRYEISGKNNANFLVNVGRTDNPFFSPTELVWDDDLGFDGISISGRYKVHENVTPFATMGAFPIFNTELNFSSNRPSKYPSDDKYLLAVQAGSNFTWGRDFSAKVAGAYYHFENVQGRLSSPFVPLTAADQGDTDDTRPSFAQRGNTYFPIRNILPTADNNFGTTNQFQYFGLAAPFRQIDFTGTLDYARFDPFHLTVFGEFVKNVAFDENRINAVAVNNRGPDQANGQIGRFEGGDTGWLIGIRAGTPAFEKRWDWQIGVNYRYLESDATIDGFNDSKFALGGTNIKGYTVFGSIALSRNISFLARWMSANEVAGPAYRNDIFQFDFNARF